ncbi:MAG: hypothetical protein Devi2KO_37840 [Devosia indica]
MVARTKTRYRPKMLDDYLCGELLVPPSSKALGSTIDGFWNALELAVGSRGPVAMDMILGLPARGELVVSEAERLVRAFAAPLVADGHAVQYDLHTLPRPGQLGPYLHAHVLLSLFGLDQFDRIRRLETRWTPLFRSSGGKNDSATLMDWQQYWARTQNEFFRSLGLDPLRVPPDLGFPEVKLGPKRRRGDAAARLVLATHRDDRRAAYADDLKLLQAVSDRRLLIESHDVTSAIRSIHPTAPPDEIEDRTEQVLGTAVRIETRAGRFYAAEQDLAEWHQAFARAGKLTGAPCSLDLPLDPVGEDVSNPFIGWTGRDGKKLTVLAGGSAEAIIGDANSGLRGPLLDLINSLISDGLIPTLVVPELSSRFTLRHTIEEFGLPCVSLSALARPGLDHNDRLRPRVLIVFDSQAVPDRLLCDLLRIAEQSAAKTILIYDQSRQEQYRDNLLSLSLLQTFADAVVVSAPLPNTPPRRFSWRTLADKFGDHSPASIVEAFERRGSLSFGALGKEDAALQGRTPIIVPSNETARTVRQWIQGRDQLRHERLGQEPRLTLGQEPPLLSGDPVCLIRDGDGRAAGCFGHVYCDGSSSDRWWIEWQKPRGRTLVNDSAAIVHACALSFRTFCDAAAQGTLFGGQRGDAAVVYLTKPGHAERMMQVAAAHQLDVCVDPRIATDKAELVVLLARWRAAGRASAVAEAVMARGETSGDGDRLPPAPVLAGAGPARTSTRRNDPVKQTASAPISNPGAATAKDQVGGDAPAPRAAGVAEADRDHNETPEPSSSPMPDPGEATAKGLEDEDDLAPSEGDAAEADPDDDQTPEAASAPDMDDKEEEEDIVEMYWDEDDAAPEDPNI